MSRQSRAREKARRMEKRNQSRNHQRRNEYKALAGQDRTKPYERSEEIHLFAVGGLYSDSWLVPKTLENGEGRYALVRTEAITRTKQVPLWEGSKYTQGMPVVEHQGWYRKVTEQEIAASRDDGEERNARLKSLARQDPMGRGSRIPAEIRKMGYVPDQNSPFYKGNGKA